MSSNTSVRAASRNRWVLPAVRSTLSVEKKLSIGIVGMVGAFESMWGGLVDRTWARQHHSGWYDGIVPETHDGPSSEWTGEDARVLARSGLVGRAGGGDRSAAGPAVKFETSRRGRPIMLARSCSGGRHVAGRPSPSCCTGDLSQGRRWVRCLRRGVLGRFEILLRTACNAGREPSMSVGWRTGATSDPPRSARSHGSGA